MQIAPELAKRIIEFRREGTSVDAIRSAKRAILDTLGVALAGSTEPASATLRTVLREESSRGNSVVLGTTSKTGCMDAALMNGTAAHALDFDDVSDAMGGHPSAPVLAALLALGDRTTATGKDVLVAFIAGFETEIRIARGVNFHHYEKGWHPTATLGVFGAAAACATLLGLEEDEIAKALSLSASMSCGIKANFGTMTKPLHVGNSARSGLLATLLVRGGFTASLEAFEHKQGFLNVFNGLGNFDADRIFDHWGEPLEIVDPGVIIKQYPCCASTHSAIDTVIGVALDEAISAEQVSSLEVWTHPRRLEHTNRPDPRTPMAAKFSVQYCVARALMHRKVVLEHFEGRAFLERPVRDLMTKVTAQPYTGEQLERKSPYGAEVKFTLRDGSIFRGESAEALGQSKRHPLPAGLLEAKFQNCAGKILPPDQVAELRSCVEGLEHLFDVRELTRLTVPRTQK